MEKEIIVRERWESAVVHKSQFWQGTIIHLLI